MANRLKLVIGSLISPFQNGFIPRRDNISIAQELIHFVRNKKQGSDYFSTIKLDMSKDFDRIRWNFLEKVLQLYGFPAKWVNLIMQCVSTVSYSVLCLIQQKIKAWLKVQVFPDLALQSPIFYLLMLIAFSFSEWLIPEFQPSNPSFISLLLPIKLMTSVKVGFPYFLTNLGDYLFWNISWPSYLFIICPVSNSLPMSLRKFHPFSQIFFGLGHPIKNLFIGKLGLSLFIKKMMWDWALRICNSLNKLF